MNFVDVLTLRQGKTVADAIAYFDKAVPILARHGFRRLKVYEIRNKMRGHEEVNPNIVQIWETRGPESFQTLAADDTYKAIVPLRDSIFDMGRLQGWFGVEV